MEVTADNKPQWTEDAERAVGILKTAICEHRGVLHDLKAKYERVKNRLSEGLDTPQNLDEVKDELIYRHALLKMTKTRCQELETRLEVLRDGDLTRAASYLGADVSTLYPFTSEEAQANIERIRADSERINKLLAEGEIIRDHVLEQSDNRASKDKNEKLFPSLGAVAFEPPQFLVYPYLPLGKITILQGDPGVGKTALACKFAAAVTTGGLVQDAPAMAGGALILSVEDDASTLRGRVERSGGNVHLCSIGDSAHNLSFTSPEIERVIVERKIRLVIFDPMQNFLGSRVNMNQANETRPVLAALAAMAKRTNCAVVIICHMNKNTQGGKSIYRSLGSIDIVAAARSVLYIGRHPQDVDQCVLVQVKSSNAKAGKSIKYRIGDHGGIEWEGYCDLLAQDLDSPGARPALKSAINYEQEPLVLVMRSLLKENPQGVFLSYESIRGYGEKLLGVEMVDASLLSSKADLLKSAIHEKDQVKIERTRARGSTHYEFGARIDISNSLPSRGIRFLPSSDSSAPAGLW